MENPIYLDYNATTPLDPGVIAAMRPFLETHFGNPSSSHYYGQAPRLAVDAARSRLARLLNCSPAEIVFTSGGTESNNHAIRGIAGSPPQKGRHIITSAVEHPAIIEVCRYLGVFGIETTYLPVDSSGMVRVEDLEKAIRPETILITIMHANNEVGTIQPVREISELARNHGIPVHTDAAQSMGKIPVDVSDLGVDLLSVAGHKVYAPKGVGALYIRQGFALENFCFGAGQEMGFRAGTENVLEITGLGKACQIAAEGLEQNSAHLQAMRDRLYTGLLNILGNKAIRCNGHPQMRLPNTLSLSFKGVQANRLLDAIAPRVAASAGAACHADVVEVSAVLKAMQVPMEWAKGTLRFSVGRMTTAEEIDVAIQVIAKAVRAL